MLSSTIFHLTYNTTGTSVLRSVLIHSGIKWHLHQNAFNNNNMAKQQTNKQSIYFLSSLEMLHAACKSITPSKVASTHTRKHQHTHGKEKGERGWTFGLAIGGEFSLQYAICSLQGPRAVLSRYESRYALRCYGLAVRSALSRYALWACRGSPCCVTRYRWLELTSSLLGHVWICLL